MLVLRKLAIQSIADPDELVILTNIGAGVDGASFFAMNEESPDELRIEDGQTVQQRKRYTLDIRGLYDATDMAQLQTWAQAQTKVRVSGLGLDECPLFRGEYLISPSQNYEQVQVVRFMLTCDTTGQFESGFRSVFSGVNLLRNYDVATGTGNLLYGSSVEAGLTPTRSSGNQTITYASGSGVAWKTEALLFPFEGEQMTGSISTTAQTGDWTIGIRFLDDTGATISQTAQGFAPGDTPGRLTSGTATVPSGTFFIQLIVAEDGATASNALTFNTPMIALGTASTYTGN